jgi:molybdate transport system substrate-binding protein
MTLRAATLPSIVVAFTLWLGVAPARAEDIRVYSSVAMHAVLDELIPRFERETGHKVVATFGVAAVLKGRIEKGEAYDLAILTPAQADDLIAQAKAVGPRTVIARSGLGLMVKAGAPKLDVGTVDAFKRTLVAAKSLTYVPGGASGVAFLAIVKQLGIAQDVESKTRGVTTGDEVNANVTSGAADIGILPISEILPVKGAMLGGVFPPDVQTYVVMAGVVSPKAPQAARDFLARLMAASSDAVLTAKGMERVKP